MSANGTQKPKYVPNPELVETYVDNLHAVGFDGVNFRLELAVTRVAATGDGGKETTRHPVSRLVMSLPTVTELLNQLGGTLRELERQGTIRSKDGGGRGGPPRSEDIN